MFLHETSFDRQHACVSICSALFKFFNRPFHPDSSRNAITFYFAAVKSNVSRILFMAKQNFVSGLCKHPLYCKKKRQSLSKRSNNQRMFTSDFISGKIKFFSSVSGQSFITVYIKYPQLYPWNKTQCGCYFIFGHFNRDEISFGMIKFYINTTPKWNHAKENIGACEYEGNIPLKLLLWHLNCNQKCFVAKKQPMHLSMFPCKASIIKSWVFR